MKNKKVLLLGTFGLVFVSGLAAVGSTYAWYQTNRSASLMFGGAAIHNRDAELRVTFLNSENGVADLTPDAINEFNFAAINRVTDISGDGIDFLKPEWGPKKDKAIEINEVDTAVDHYVDFLFKFERLNQPEISDGRGLKVYLGEDTKFEPVDDSKDKDIESLKSVRMAVVKYDAADRSNPEVVFIYAPEAEADAKYLKHTGVADDKTYNQEGYVLEDQDIVTGAFKTEDKQADATFEFIDLMTDTEAFIAFRVWIEGEDKDTVLQYDQHGHPGTLGGMFKFNLDIYSLHD